MPDDVKPVATLLKHETSSIRDFWFEDDILVIRQITISPNGFDAAVKVFRLTKPEYIKLAEIIVSLVQETRKHIAVAGGEG